MKPYEFYKKGIHDLNISENWDFYNGQGKTGVPLRHFNDINWLTPTDKMIYDKQTQAIVNILNKLKDNPDYKSIKTLISWKSNELKNIFNSKQYQDVKKGITPIKNIVNSINKNKYLTHMSNKPKKSGVKIVEDYLSANNNDKEAIQKMLNSSFNYAQLKKQLISIKKEYNDLLKNITYFENEIQNSNITGLNLMEWNDLNNRKNAMTKTLKSIKKAIKDVASKNNQNIMSDISFNQLDIFYQNFLSASNKLSEIVGEYTTSYFLKKIINDSEKIGQNFLDIINVGNITYKAGDKIIKLPFDEIVVTSSNKELKLNLNIDGVPKEKKLGELQAFLTQIQHNNNNKIVEHKIVINNYEELINSNALHGYTIQTKFRKNPAVISNINDGNSYTINEAIDSIHEDPNTYDIQHMVEYARNLDLFVKWYLQSAAKYPVVKGSSYPGIVYATYTPEKPATIVYNQYFNYILSREEVIEKIYGPSVFFFVTAGGSITLEDFFSEKLKYIRYPDIFSGSRYYSILRPHRAVDLRLADTKKITLSPSSRIKSYNK